MSLEKERARRRGPAAAPPEPEPTPAPDPEAAEDVAAEALESPEPAGRYRVLASETRASEAEEREAARWGNSVIAHLRSGVRLSDRREPDGKETAMPTVDLYKQIVAYVREHGPIGRKEIAEGLGISQNELGHRLMRGKRDGDLEVTGATTAARWTATGVNGAAKPSAETKARPLGKVQRIQRDEEKKRDAAAPPVAEDDPVLATLRAKRQTYLDQFEKLQGEIARVDRAIAAYTA